MLEVDTVLQGRYRIVSQIGKGGMGTVFLARDQNLGLSVAIKQNFFDEARLIEAFKREARLLAGLRHSALAQVKDYFIDPTGQYLVMEHIAGDDLGNLLEKRKQKIPPIGQAKPFDVDEVVRWAEQLLDALDYLHTRPEPVIHRDIKPQNLKLADRSQIILLDFGLAKGKPLWMTRVTSTGSLYGYTPNYAPIEQIRGVGTDPRSDLYALGATLYHLITGGPPIDAATRAESFLGGEPDPLRPANEVNLKVPHGIAAVLMKAMEPHRNNRPSSAAELLKMLRAAKLSTVIDWQAKQEKENQTDGEAEQAGTAEHAKQATNAWPTTHIAFDKQRKEEQQATEDAVRQQQQEEQERTAKEEAERKQREEQERKASEEAQRMQQEEAELKAKEEAERRQREEQERKAREETERIQQEEEAERKAKEEAERKRREQQERNAREEEQRKEADRLRTRQRQEELGKQFEQENAQRLRQKEERARIAREEADRRQKDEEENKARKEAEQLRLHREDEQKARKEAERRQREEQEHRAKEEERIEAKEEAELKQLQEEKERKVREAAEKLKLQQEELRKQLAREDAQRWQQKQEQGHGARGRAESEKPERSIRLHEERVQRQYTLLGVGALVLIVFGTWMAVSISRDADKLASNPPIAGEPSTPSPNDQTKRARLGPGKVTTPVRVLKVALSDDAQVLASAGDETSVRLWQMLGTRELIGPKQRVTSVAVSHNGQIVASGCEDGSINLWRVADGQLIKSWTGHVDYIFSVGFNRDGSRLFSAGGDKSVKLWSVSDGKLIKSVTSSDKDNLIVTVSPDLRLMGVYLKNGRFASYLLADNSLVSELAITAPPVNCGAFSSEGETVALGGKYGDVLLCRVGDGRLIRALGKFDSGIISLTFSEDGQTLAVGLENGSIPLLHVNDGKLVKTLSGHVKPVNSLSFSADGRTLASGGEDKTVRVWDLAEN